MKPCYRLSARPDWCQQHQREWTHLTGCSKDPFWSKPLKTEVEFTDVDPEVLGILTGGVLGTLPAPTFSLEVHTPGRRRTLWEWLRRKPRHYPSSMFIPNATLGTTGEQP